MIPVQEVINMAKYILSNKAETFLRQSTYFRREVETALLIEKGYTEEEIEKSMRRVCE